MHRVFLLSPAHPGGRRAALLLNPRAGFSLAQALQRGEARPLGEIFSFVSGLYFRGKLAYAAAFAKPPRATAGALIITSHRGLMPAGTLITLDEIRAFASVPIDPHEPRYRRPLQSTARLLARKPQCEFVLLGSISTDKYVEPLLKVFGERLLFPIDFLGRGDMSRGGLMLRRTRDGQELAYERLAGAVRRGARPAKLGPVSPPAIFDGAAVRPA